MATELSHTQLLLATGGKDPAPYTLTSGGNITGMGMFGDSAAGVVLGVAASLGGVMLLCRKRRC
jgi:hypothetical protein